MVNANEFKEIALALEGTTEYPHFERIAFKARRTFATLAPDGLSANIRFAPDEQDFRCAAQPDAYRPIPNKWGAQGWTIATLAALTPEELQVALTSAWRAQVKVKRVAPKKRT